MGAYETAAEINGRAAIDRTRRALENNKDGRISMPSNELDIQAARKLWKHVNDVTIEDAKRQVRNAIEYKLKRLIFDSLPADVIEELRALGFTVTEDDKGVVIEGWAE